MSNNTRQFLEDHTGRGVMSGNQGKTGAELDAVRKRNTAYEYLCHLEEARKWLEACLSEDMPPASGLEKALRNGIIVAKLSCFFAPDVSKQKKIYDIAEKVYKERGLVFRHTDNINMFLRAMESMKFPEIFYPETTDLYDKKNMPRVIYCLHALSRYLYQIGIAPEMEDLKGIAQFTEEELSAMEQELQKAGVQMPKFGKIGGILAKELGQDDAAMHAAVLKINQALENEEPTKVLLGLMKHPAVKLHHIDDGQGDNYRDTLIAAKMEKTVNAPATSYLAQEEGEEDLCLAHGEVTAPVAQGTADTSDAKGDDSGPSSSKTAPPVAPKKTGAKKIPPPVAAKRIKRPSKARVPSESEAVDIYDTNLTRDEIQKVVNGINMAAEAERKRRAIEHAIQQLSESVDEQNVAKMQQALADEDLSITEVNVESGDFYMKELTTLQHSLPEDQFFTREQIQEAINRGNDAADIEHQKESALSDILAALKANDDDRVAALLQQHAVLLDLPAFDTASTQQLAQHLREHLDDGPFSAESIRAAIRAVNGELEHQRAFAAAVKRVNVCIDGGDADKTIEALLDPILALEEVDEAGALHYQEFLEERKQAKNGEDLTSEDIQKAVLDSNYEAEENAKHACAIYALNDVVRKDKKPKKTLKCMRDPYCHLENIDDACAERYQTALYNALESRGWVAGSDIKVWKRYTTDDGKDYYYNKTTKETQWIPPIDVAEKNLTLEEIQTEVDVCNKEHARWEELKAATPTIVRLQAVIRGLLQRQKYNDRRRYLAENEGAVVKLQAAFRGFKEKKKYQDRLQYLNGQSASAVKIQAAFKGWKERQQYKALTKGESPPVPTIRRFLHLLDQSDVDFAEELERQELKHRVVTAIRNNHELDAALNSMDIKIGLLVKNRIELQDVVKHNKELKRARRRGSEQRLTLQHQHAGLKSLTKESREKLQAFQNLFYLLQTEPSVLASLVFLDEVLEEWSQNKVSYFLQQTLQLIYNYGSNEREQFLLLRLYVAALKTEVSEKVNHVRELITGNPTAIKLVVLQYRNAAQENHFFDVMLKELVDGLLSDDAMDLNTDPREVYKAWIGQTERETGVASTMPRDVSREEALKHPEVNETVVQRVKQLIDVSQQFLDAIVANVHRLPYGLRHVCKQLEESLKEKFPDAEEDEIIKVLGNVIYYRFINPAIIAPDAFDVVNSAVQMTSVQRRNLGSIAKLLQYAASGQRFDASDTLSELNAFLLGAWSSFRDYFLKVTDVKSPVEHFQVDEYSDAVMLTKPTISISPYDMYYIHRMLADNIDRIALGEETLSKLREILGDLGSPGSPLETLGETDSAEFSSNKTPISLSLQNKFEVPEDDTSDTKTLFVRTKKLVVDVIRFQHGKTLAEILETPASAEMEAEHKKFATRRQEELQQLAAKAHDADEAEQVKEIAAFLTLEETKAKILANAAILEKEGLCSADSGYQKLLNAVAHDIRYQTIYRQQRRAELAKMRTALSELEAKKKQQAQSIDFYDTYVKECMKQLDKGNKAPSRRWYAIRKQKKAEGGQRIGSYSSNAAKLKDKGVIISVDGVTPTQLKTVSIEVRSDELGVFQIKAKMLGKTIEAETLEFQDLLQKQYENVDTIKLFGMCTLNVNLLIFLINKKFYHS